MLESEPHSDLALPSPAGPVANARTGRRLDLSILAAAVAAFVLLVGLYLAPLVGAVGRAEAASARPAGTTRNHAGFLGAMTGATLLESVSLSAACTAAFDSFASDSEGPALLEPDDRDEFLRSCGQAVNGR